MGVFDNAQIVKINNKEVESIKTNDGGIIYQRPVKIIVTGNSVTLGKGMSGWLTGDNDVIIYWGDGTSSVYGLWENNPINHTYTDGKSNHTIIFVGVVTQLKGAFKESNIISIVVPSSVTSLGSYCFEECTNLNLVTLPNSVTSLGQSCFYNCTSLASITLPNSITNLGDMCFTYCTSLASITIPNSVTSISDYCFYACSGLTSVTIPSNVTNLGSNCFCWCDSLNTYQLYWTGNNIITYDNSKMPNNTNTKFYVPQGQKTNYVNKGYPSADVIERSS